MHVHARSIMPQLAPTIAPKAKEAPSASETWQVEPVKERMGGNGRGSQQRREPQTRRRSLLGPGAALVATLAVLSLGEDEDASTGGPQP